MEILKLSKEKVREIHNNRLPNGYGVFDGDDGSMFATLNLFWGNFNQVMLCVEVEVRMALGDALVHREIINVDRNPELWALYDRDQQAFVTTEVFDLLDGYLVDVYAKEVVA